MNGHIEYLRGSTCFNTATDGVSGFISIFDFRFAVGLIGLTCYDLISKMNKLWDCR